MRKIFVLALLAIAGAIPAAASAAPRATLTLKPSAIKVLYGKSVALSGRLAGRPAGTTVQVLAWRYGA